MKFIFLSIIFFYSLFAQTLEVGFVYWKKNSHPEKYEAYVYGINKAIQEINKKHLFGENTKLKLVTFNEEGNVQKSIEIAKEIKNNHPNMIAIIGFSNSKRAIKAIKYISEAGIPVISSAGSRTIFKNDPNGIFFTTNFGINGEMQYLKKFIKVKNYKNIVAIYNDKDKYSQEYISYIKKLLPTKTFNSRDIKIQIDNLKKAINKNTLIIISTDVSTNAKVAKILRENGITNDIFLGKGGIVGDEFYKAGGYGIKNIYELSELLAGVSNETLLKFKNDNKKYFSNPKNAKYLEYAAYAYDCMNLIVEAYLRAAVKPENNPKRIRQLIKIGLLMINQKKPFDGVATTYSFDKNRIGGKLVPQYILESTGKQPSLFKKQFIYQNGKLSYVPTLYTNIDVKSINVDNQEASVYTINMMITLISEKNISLKDLDFENILISDSNFIPSIYSKEFKVNNVENEDYNVKIYNVTAKFEWGNTIEDFPFDKQKLTILIKPKDPIHNNFINFFISDINNNLKNIDISGWSISNGYAGFKKGFYEYIGPDLEKYKKYYYRSSYTIEVQRKALSSAIKFILPLAIVLIVTLVLFILPDHASGDKVGAATNMLITIAALYFTYATLVDVDYVTFIDKLYIFSLLFVLLTNILFIYRQRIDEEESHCFSLKTKHKKANLIYIVSFIIATISFLIALWYFFEKATL